MLMNDNPYASPRTTPATAVNTSTEGCPVCSGPLVEGTLRSATFIHWHRKGRITWLGRRISRLSFWSGAMVIPCHRCEHCGYIGIPPEGRPPGPAEQ